MAFQSMISGAECSTSNNPLSSLLKQQQQDHSLHQSTFHPGPGAASNIRSAHAQNGNHAEAERFFQQQRAAGGGGGGGPGFGMEGLRRELEQVNRDKAMSGDREWASQYHPAQSSLSPADVAKLEEQYRQSQASGMSAEFMRQRHSPSPHPFVSAAPAPAAATSYQPTYTPTYSSAPYMNMGYGGGMGMMGGGVSPMHHQQQPVVDSGKGKGRFVELNDADWEAQFARMSQAPGENQTAEATTTAEDKGKGKARAADLLEGDVTIEPTSEEDELLAQLEKTWSKLQSTVNQSSVADAEMAAWEAQYGTYNEIMADGESGLDDLRTNKVEWTKDNVDSFLQADNAFPYSTENKYSDHQDPFAEGQRLLAEGAPLSEAALAFEAACKLNPNRAEAWRAAGETWSADEREIKGIRALEKAVGCGGPDALQAWMSLAVAYVNEGQELRALATLEKWLSLAYPMLSAPPIPAESNNPWDASTRITDMFIAAAQAGPSARAAGQGGDLGVVDPDVQIGLGVLFYSNSDYDRAKDCFEAALSVRPDDFLLWNRLGATLANGGSSEEAISAYRKALDLRPTFTRATYNLGVSCLNIGCYQEAAEHLLAAIEGQKTRAGKGLTEAEGGDDDGSANLWMTLRRAFLCLENHELAEMSHAGTDLNEFRSRGFEF